MKVCDALGIDNGSIVGAKDEATLGFVLGREVGIHEGTVIGASLGLRDVEVLGNDEVSIEGAKDGSALGFTLGREEGIQD